MILLYILFLIAGVVTFFITAKLSIIFRLGIAVVVFVVPSIVMTYWILKVGDKAPPDAITIYPNHMGKNTKDTNRQDEYKSDNE